MYLVLLNFTNTKYYYTTSQLSWSNIFFAYIHKTNARLPFLVCNNRENIVKIYENY